MFGVLIVVLCRDPIARLEFCLGQSHVPLVVSSRVVRILCLSATRAWRRLLRPASKWSLLVPIEIFLAVHAVTHSLEMTVKKPLAMHGADKFMCGKRAELSTASARPSAWCLLTRSSLIEIESTPPPNPDPPFFGFFR